MSKPDFSKPTVSCGQTFYTVSGLELTKYSDGNLAIVAVILWDDGDKEKLTVSINLAHGQPVQSKDLDEGGFFAKNYCQNERLYDTLLATGWLVLVLVLVLTACTAQAATSVTGATGHVVVPACRIGPNAKILT